MSLLTRSGKVVRVLLFLQAGVAVAVGAGYLAGAPGFGDAGADARKTAAFLGAFAVLLFLAGRRPAEDGRWIHPVIAVVAFNLADSTYELFGRGDTTFVPALGMETVFLGAYVAFAVAAARRHPARALRAAPSG